MPYCFRAEHSVAEEFRRIAHEQLERGLDDARENDPHEAVHELRKRMKKVRGLIRLVRPAFSGYARANAWFRDTARIVSDLRDATSLIECLDALAERYGKSIGANAFEITRKRLWQRRERLVADQGLDLRLQQVCRRVEAGQALVDEWRLDREGWEALGGGLEKTYKRARNRLADCRDKPTTENLHEWRKRVKYHRYHLKLLRRSWDPVIMAHRDAAKRLSDLLGDDHDIAVFLQILNDERLLDGAEPGQALRGLLEQRRQELQAQAMPLGKRLFHDGPATVRDRFGAYWAAFETESALHARIPEPARAVS
ncbi:MAG: CHAD domain-containing protein [Xanthomonadales bacterium]|nr:CHAD domain-containing protein [Xanthomonadales bacterium]